MNIYLGKRGLAALASILLASCSVTPQPFTDIERNQAIEKNLTELYSTQVTPVRSLTLSEAIARAITYNHDVRLQAYATVVEQRQVDVSNWSIMPDIVASAGYRARGTDNLVLSKNIASGTVSTNPSISEDKARGVADLTFSWNVLDFGLSYLRAQQQADKYLQASERDRRVRHQIVQEAITAWYRAKTAEELEKNISPLMVRVRRAIDASRSAEASRAETPLVALSYQRELLDMLQMLDSMKRDLSSSGNILAALTGLPPSNSVHTGNIDVDIRRPSYSRKELERIALHQRPDVRVSLYQARITESEASVALASLLPVPSIQAGPSYDSNSYTVNHNWIGMSAQIAQSLLKPLRYETTSRLNDARDALAREQALAVTAASLLQVNLADEMYGVAQDALKTAEMQLDVSRRIHKQTRNATLLEQQGEITLIREDMKLVLSQVRRDLAAQEVRSAAAKLLVSTGFDVYPEGFKDEDIDAIAKQVRRNIADAVSKKVSYDVALKSPSGDAATSSDAASGGLLGFLFGAKPQVGASSTIDGSPVPVDHYNETVPTVPLTRGEPSWAPVELNPSPNTPEPVQVYLPKSASGFFARLSGGGETVSDINEFAKPANINNPNGDLLMKDPINNGDAGSVLEKTRAQISTFNDPFSLPLPEDILRLFGRLQAPADKQHATLESNTAANSVKVLTPIKRQNSAPVSDVKSISLTKVEAHQVVADEVHIDQSKSHGAANSLLFEPSLGVGGETMNFNEGSHRLQREFYNLVFAPVRQFEEAPVKEAAQFLRVGTSRDTHVSTYSINGAHIIQSGKIDKEDISGLSVSVPKKANSLSLSLNLESTQFESKLATKILQKPKPTAQNSVVAGVKSKSNS